LAAGFFSSITKVSSRALKSNRLLRAFSSALISPKIVFSTFCASDQRRVHMAK
jgi:hypothetical protein